MPTPESFQPPIPETISPFEQWLSLELPKQYEAWADALNQLGLIAPMPKTWIDDKGEIQIDVCGLRSAVRVNELGV